MGTYCHTRVSCACALRAHPPPTTKTDSRLASIAAFAYNLCLCPSGPPTQKKIKKTPDHVCGLGLVINNYLTLSKIKSTSDFFPSSLNSIL